jgi:hypothetical protein
MKVNDKVDVMSDVDYNPYITWITGWTIEIISGDWALIMKTEESDEDGHPPLKRIERKKVALATLRPAHPGHKTGETQVQVVKLPEAGAGVMFKIPGDFNQRWEFGLVVHQNKNSVKVLHDSKLINRNRSQFIELQDESV